MNDPINYERCDALIIAILRSLLSVSQSQVEDAEALVCLLSEGMPSIEVEMCKVEALARLTMADEYVEEEY